MPPAARPTKRKVKKKSNTRKAKSAKRLIKPEDILLFHFVSNPRISPCGEEILFTKKHIGEKNNYITNLWTVPVKGGDPVQFTSGDKDSSGRFSPDGEKVAFIRASKETGKSQIFTIKTTGGEASALTDFPEGALSSFKWSPDGKSIAATFRATGSEWTKVAEKERKENGASTPPRITEDLWYKLDGDGYFLSQRFEIYIINVANGKHRSVFKKSDLGFYTYDWSPDSRKLAITADPQKNSLIKLSNDRIYILNAKSGKSQTIPNMPKGPKAEVRWSPDGKKIAYAGREGGDSEYSTENLHLYICDAVKGNAVCLTGKEDYCLLSISLSDTSEAVFGPAIAWQPDGKRIFTRIGWQGEGHIASVSPTGGKLKFHTSGEFEYSMGTFSPDGKRLAVIRGETMSLPEVGVIEPASKNGSTNMLTSFNEPYLSKVEVAPIKSHWVKTKDGNKVQVWVMKPTKSSRKKIPAVMEIHGGPHAQYSIAFFHEFQVLAAAGYGVIFSNPRGSKGYGRDHCHAIRGSWGGADWVDIQAVKTFMKRQTWIDSKRMGVMGGSYGGYMTNWVIGHTNDFAGAITDRCVSNLLSMWGNSDFANTPDRYWEGNVWDRPEASWKASPIQYMGSARTPTLIIHSEGDLRCNVEQSEQVFTVLRTHDVPTRFVRYPSTTSHGMSRGGPPDMRMHRLNQILGWWKKYLK